MRVTAFSIVASAAFALSSCAGPNASPRRQSPTAEPCGLFGPVELELKTSSGMALELSRLRNKRVVLLFFTTFDDASQLALREAARFQNERSDASVVGVALQPDPKPLLGPYAEVLDVNFPLTYDPTGDVLAGKSPLGQLPGLPLVVSLNEGGTCGLLFRGVAHTRDLHGMVPR